MVGSHFSLQRLPRVLNPIKKYYKYCLPSYLGIIALYITAILKKLTLSLPLGAFFVWQNGISVN